MRHTAATLWLAAGEAPEWIARQLGHTSTEMLFRVYSRYVPNLTRQDGSAMERLLASRLGAGVTQAKQQEVAEADKQTRAARRHTVNGAPVTQAISPQTAVQPARGPFQTKSSVVISLAARRGEDHDPQPPPGWPPRQVNQSTQPRD